MKNCLDKGDTIVLIRVNSGCGKTSLLRILLGFYPIENDKIYLNGRDINSFDKHTLRENISYASQSVFLKNDSILNNIIYPDNKYHSVNEIHEILDALNLNYKNVNEIIGEEGKNLSGGERGRIAFARALKKQAGIIILDEITAALDKKNEDLIIDALVKTKKDRRMIFIVSHSNNLNLLKIADKVIDF